MTVKSIDDLVGGSDGYTVVQADRLRKALCVALRSHVSAALGCELFDREDDLFDALFLNHNVFRQKSSRIFSLEQLSPIISATSEIFVKNDIGTVFQVSDEEALGHPNIYFRVVRARATEDVGPMHKDKWFWDLGHGSIEKDKARAKLWVPIVQDDSKCSLVIVPGSHRMHFDYASRVEDGTGKIKPVFNRRVVENQIVSAPVRVGEAIIFNDELLHGGIATEHDRISAELTLVYRRKGC